MNDQEKLEQKRWSFPADLIGNVLLLRGHGANWGNFKPIMAEMGNQEGKIAWGQAVMSTEFYVTRFGVYCVSHLLG